MPSSKFKFGHHQNILAVLRPLPKAEVSGIEGEAKRKSKVVHKDALSRPDEEDLGFGNQQNPGLKAPARLVPLGDDNDWATETLRDGDVQKGEVCVGKIEFVAERSFLRDL